MTQYFRGSMKTTSSEPHHRIVFADGMVTLQQRGKDNFAVRYGMQVDAELTYSQAAAKLGQALMHQLACDDKLDSRKRGER